MLEQEKHPKETNIIGLRFRYNSCSNYVQLRLRKNGWFETALFLTGKVNGNGSRGTNFLKILSKGHGYNRVKPSRAALASIMQASCSLCCSASHTAPWKCTWWSEDTPNPGVSHSWGRKLSLGSWFQPGPTPVTTAIWGRDQQIEDLYLSPCNSRR